MTRFQAIALSGLFIVVSTVTSSSAQTRSCPALKQGIPDPKFQPGQVWSYQTRRGEEASTLIILRVDSLPKLGTIVHIRVDGLNAHNLRGEVVPSVLHMPFDRDALVASVIALKTKEQVPTLEGPERWQLDCGGVYTITVRTAITVMEKTLNAR